MTNKPLRVVVQLDWNTLYCPCGCSLYTRGISEEEYVEFVEKHKAHTNGTILEEYDVECLTVLTSIPKPTIRIIGE